MHLPDGFIDPKMSFGLAAAAAAVVGFCLAKVRAALTAVVPQAALAAAGRTVTSIVSGSKRALTRFGEQRLYLMGMVAALVFSAQMFNFPVASGTSGHLIGGVLAAVLLGPFAGTLVIAAVLLIQMMFFADGGLVALGANIINMAVIGSFLSYYVYAGLKKILPEWLSIGLAAWLSVVLASLACALEIGFSGTFTLPAVTSAMLRVHVIIGLCEAFITIILIAVFRRLVPGSALVEEKAGAED